jgi:hypothetical protein
MDCDSVNGFIYFCSHIPRRDLPQLFFLTTLSVSGLYTSDDRVIKECGAVDVVRIYRRDAALEIIMMIIINSVAFSSQANYTE